jgi:hypothetical protein
MRDNCKHLHPADVSEEGSHCTHLLCIKYDNFLSGLSYDPVSRCTILRPTVGCLMINLKSLSNRGTILEFT